MKVVLTETESLMDEVLSAEPEPAPAPEPEPEPEPEKPKAEKKTKAEKKPKAAKKPKVKKTKAKKAKEPSARGRDARPFAQIDPETLNVVKVWPTMKAARREMGAQNLGRATEQLRKSVGFYWCDADDVDAFTERLRAKKELERMIAWQKKAAKVKDTKREKKTVTEETGQEPAATVSEALKKFCDVELFRELERRGWHIELRKTAVAGIG